MHGLVPDQVLQRMAARLEPPHPKKLAWSPPSRLSPLRIFHLLPALESFICSAVSWSGLWAVILAMPLDSASSKGAWRVKPECKTAAGFGFCSDMQA